MLAVFGAGLSLQAQTNRNYNSDLRTNRIYEMERRGARTDVDNTRVRLNSGLNNQETEELIEYQNQSLQMNETQEFQGNRQVNSLQDHHQIGSQGLDHEDNPAINNDDQNGLQMNEMQQFSGNVIRTEGPNYTPATIETDVLPYRSVPYDTTKNNGHCLGCGSGTLTDPHPWK